MGFKISRWNCQLSEAEFANLWGMLLRPLIDLKVSDFQSSEYQVLILRSFLTRQIACPLHKVAVALRTILNGIFLERDLRAAMKAIVQTWLGVWPDKELFETCQARMLQAFGITLTLV